MTNDEDYVSVLAGKQTKGLFVKTAECYLFIAAKNTNFAVDLHVNHALCHSDGLMDDEWCLLASLGRRPGCRLITFS